MKFGLGGYTNLLSRGTLKQLFFWGFYSALLCYYSVVLIIQYDGNHTGWHPPLPIWFMDMINLFIHEGGHFFFGFFGMTIGILGGSLMQVLIPILVLWVYRANQYVQPISLFWIGESLINVSVYIADAPYRRLRLISPNALHDWYYLAGRLGIRESIEVIADIVRVCGSLVMISGCIAGVYYFAKYLRGSIVEPSSS